jgi:phage terminase, large subunit, PBSX family
VYSWKENKYEPEDGNDHTINANQYAWLPFKREIGIGGK